MTAVDAVSLNLSLLQTICAGVLFACFVGAVIAGCAFVGVLIREHIKTWHRAPRYRALILVPVRKHF